MKKLLIIIVILSYEMSLKAQSTSTIDNTSPMEASIAVRTLSTNNFKANDLEYEDIRGTPYLEKEFLTGYLVMIDKNRSDEVSLQYDIYSGDFLYLNNKEEELTIDLKHVRSVVMQGGEENYLFKRLDPRTPHKFYEILYESDAFDLYNDIQINFYEGKEQGITKIDPRFARDDNYYILRKGEERQKIKLKKKDIFKLFSKEEQKEMNNIVKDNNIKLKKSKDFKQLFLAMKTEN